VVVEERPIGTVAGPVDAMPVVIMRFLVFPLFRCFAVGLLVGLIVELKAGHHGLFEGTVVEGPLCGRVVDGGRAVLAQYLLFVVEFILGVAEVDGVLESVFHNNKRPAPIIFY
jgi:hypothetical protein